MSRSRQNQIGTLAHDYPDGYRLRAHEHREAQLVYANAGVMTVRIGRAAWMAPPDRGVWIPGGERHAIDMSGEVAMRTMYFPPKFSPGIAPGCFVFDVQPLLRELILYACTREKLDADGPLVPLILDRVRAASMTPLDLLLPDDSRAARIAKILSADPADPRSLAELCKKAGGSPRTLERAFVRETGLSFGRWRQQLRFLHGVRLVAGGVSVTEASLASGYESTSAFIAAFKKSFGKTPRQYLKGR